MDPHNRRGCQTPSEFKSLYFKKLSVLRNLKLGPAPPALRKRKYLGSIYLGTPQRSPGTRLSYLTKVELFFDKGGPQLRVVNKERIIFSKRNSRKRLGETKKHNTHNLRTPPELRPSHGGVIRTTWMCVCASETYQSE